MKLKLVGSIKCLKKNLIYRKRGLKNEKSKSISSLWRGGIATSSFAAMEIEALAKEVNVQVEIHKERIVNAPSVANDYDLMCVTSRFNQDLKPKIIQVGGLILE